MPAMQQIRILTPMVGHGFSRNRGDEVEVSNDEAGRLVAAGFAVAIDPKAKTPETPPAKPKGKAKKTADDPKAKTPETPEGGDGDAK